MELMRLVTGASSFLQGEDRKTVLQKNNGLPSIMVCALDLNSGEAGTRS